MLIVRDQRSLEVDPYGRANYARGSANLEARAALWSYVGRADGDTRSSIDWFCDLVEWTDVSVAADIGTGSGRFLPSLARRARYVVGLDLSPGMLDEVAAAQGHPLVRGDVCRLPFRDDSVDRALAAWMLYHAADPDAACAELRRVVRPNGALIAVTNAAAHAAELDDIYAEATEELFGNSRPRPRLSANHFTLDNAALYLSSHFQSVTIHVRRVRFRVPTPEPVVAYLASFRSRIDEEFRSDGSSFDDLAPHIEATAYRRIAATGAVEVTALPAAVLCR